MAEHRIQHPVLGPIRGLKKSAAVVQYLGLQYATLRDRFARGQILLNPSPDHIRRREGVLDATENGPIPLLPPNACESEQKMIFQKTLPYREVQQSDIGGLTLNITAPSVEHVPSLPVLVFVYGGGFTTGSTVYPQYDLLPITQMSIDIGTPMISVGINYRTGATGFLHCSVMKENGYMPNNGLDDQMLALRWIQHNIAGFGGDPSRVTFVGESAGAVSGWFHLQSPEPLFHQLVAMSGSSFLRPRPLSLLEKGFAMAAAVLGAEGRPPAAQLARLLAAPKEEFAGKVARQIPVGPLMDGDLVKHSTSFKDLVDKHSELADWFPAIKHCTRLMMGDCQMDGMGFSSRLKNRSDIWSRSLAKCLSNVFDSIDNTIAPDIVCAYGLDTAATSNTPKTTKPVLDFLGDVSFAFPTRYLTRSWSASSVAGSQAYLYHFNSPNPWEGPWEGLATHALDIGFALQNYAQCLSPGQRQCSEQFAKAIIAFVCGASPWPPYEAGVTPGAMVYYAPADGDEDESEYVEAEDPERTGRKSVLLDIVGEGQLDKLIEASQMFLIAPPLL